METEPDPNEIDPVAFAEEFNARIKQTEPSSSEPGRIEDEEEFDEFVSAMISDADPDLVRDAFPTYFKNADTMGDLAAWIEETDASDLDPAPFSDE